MHAGEVPRALRALACLYALVGCQPERDPIIIPAEPGDRVIVAVSDPSGRVTRVEISERGKIPTPSLNEGEYAFLWAIGSSNTRGWDGEPVDDHQLDALQVELTADPTREGACAACLAPRREGDFAIAHAGSRCAPPTTRSGGWRITDGSAVALGAEDGLLTTARDAVRIVWPGDCACTSPPRDGPDPALELCPLRPQGSPWAPSLLAVSRSGVIAASATNYTGRLYPDGTTLTSTLNPVGTEVRGLVWVGDRLVVGHQALGHVGTTFDVFEPGAREPHKGPTPAIVLRTLVATDRGLLIGGHANEKAAVERCPDLEENAHCVRATIECVDGLTEIEDVERSSSGLTAAVTEDGRFIVEYADHRWRCLPSEKNRAYAQTGDATFRRIQQIGSIGDRLFACADFEEQQGDHPVVHHWVITTTITGLTGVTATTAAERLDQVRWGRVDFEPQSLCGEFAPHAGGTQVRLRTSRMFKDYDDKGQLVASLPYQEGIFEDVTRTVIHFAASDSGAAILTDDRNIFAQRPQDRRFERIYGQPGRTEVVAASLGDGRALVIEVGFPPLLVSRLGSNLDCGSIELDPVMIDGLEPLFRKVHTATLLSPDELLVAGTSTSGAPALAVIPVGPSCLTATPPSRCAARPVAGAASLPAARFVQAASPRAGIVFLTARADSAPGAPIDTYLIEVTAARAGPRVEPA